MQSGQGSARGWGLGWEEHRPSLASLSAAGGRGRRALGLALLPALFFDLERTTLLRASGHPRVPCFPPEAGVGGWALDIAPWSDAHGKPGLRPHQLLDPRVLVLPHVTRVNSVSSLWKIRASEICGCRALPQPGPSEALRALLFYYYHL